jgi:outer membrane receptor protein involved in Fe transport
MRCHHRFSFHPLARAGLALVALLQAGASRSPAERPRREHPDVPNSVSALSGELLDVLNTGGQDIRLLSARVPSLNIESSFGRAFPRFYIRGYGNTDFRLNASRSRCRWCTTTWCRRTPS